MSIKLSSIIDKLNQLAPNELAEAWDNVGLLVGDKEANINKVLVALDATDLVIEEAISKDVDLIITHHPVIFKGIKQINTQSVVGNKVIKLITNNISLFSAHTNLDSAKEGISTILADRLQLKDCNVLAPSNCSSECSCGIGRIGYIDKILLNDLCKVVKSSFGLNNVKVVGDLNKIVTKVAVSPGSSMEYADIAYKQGADVFITGDIKYHDAQDYKEKGVALIDAGHFGTEHMIVQELMEKLQKWFGNNIEIINAKSDVDPFIIV
jgi:dinuclear metal center YbgI/SA1388 family protein